MIQKESQIETVELKIFSVVPENIQQRAKKVLTKNDKAQKKFIELMASGKY